MMITKKNTINIKLLIIICLRKSNKHKRCLNSFFITLQRSYNDKSLLTIGPEVNFWRAPVDNDYGAGTQSHFKVWKDVSTLGVVRVEVKQVSKSEVQIIFTRDIFNGDAQVVTTYLVNGSAHIKITNELKAFKAEYSNFYKFGNKLVLPEEYKNITYYMVEVLLKLMQIDNMLPK